MTTTPLTLFTFGYEGWGNWTDKLVEAVDAVESSRGRGPPLFVDVRASRKVRAEGFRERAFEHRFGPDRYRWMNGLGNKAILTHDSDYVLVNPSAASDLLDLAIEMNAANRRVIYFCSCISPTDGCHRHWIARHLFEVAEARQQQVTVVEWPGFESDGGKFPSVRTTERILKAMRAGQRKNLPLGEELPAVGLLGLPWFSPVDLVDEANGEALSSMFTGPAQHRAQGWQLPMLGGMHDVLEEAVEYQQLARHETCAMPRSWPANEPAQRPLEWPSE